MKLDLEAKREVIEVLEDLDPEDDQDLYVAARVLEVFGLVPHVDEDGNVFLENLDPLFDDDVEWGGDDIWWDSISDSPVDVGDPSMMERKGQAISCKYLTHRGWTVVVQNVDSLIDIVAVDDEGVVIPIHVIVAPDSQKAPDPVPSNDVLPEFLNQCSEYIDSLRTYGPEYRQPGKLPNHIDWRVDCIGIGLDADSSRAQLRHLVGVDE